MIEIHYVFENEPAARFHFVPESQNCLQGLAIIDPAYFRRAVGQCIA